MNINLWLLCDRFGCCSEFVTAQLARYGRFSSGVRLNESGNQLFGSKWVWKSRWITSLDYLTIIRIYANGQQRCQLFCLLHFLLNVFFQSIHSIDFGIVATNRCLTERVKHQLFSRYVEKFPLENDYANYLRDHVPTNQPTNELTNEYICMNVWMNTGMNEWNEMKWRKERKKESWAELSRAGSSFVCNNNSRDADNGTL